MTPAERARLEADLAAARLRVERAVVDQSGAGPDDAAEAAATVLAAEADVAELEERLGAPAAPAPPAPANDTAAPLPFAPANEDDWLTTKEAAAVMRVTVSGLERMRARGDGPPFTRVGRSVRYRRRDLTK